jgi:hypothetical protein
MEPFDQDDGGRRHETDSSIHGGPPSVRAGVARALRLGRRETNADNAKPVDHGKAKRLTAPDGLGSDETRPDPLEAREQHAGIMAGTEIRVKPIIDTGASTI